MNALISSLAMSCVSVQLNTNVLENCYLQIVDFISKLMQFYILDDYRVPFFPLYILRE
jgi:hypothetical protein